MNDLIAIDVVAEQVTPKIEEFNYKLITNLSDREWAESAAGFITFGLGQAVFKVLEAGNLLIEAKNRLPHGEYLPWVQQACGLKPQYAQKLIQAAEFVNAAHERHLDQVTDCNTLFILSAEATTEDVREWFMERCAAGDVPSRKEVQERKRNATPSSRERSLAQEALAALKFSPEARELAAKAEHISTLQLMQALGVEELPKGKVHTATGWQFHKNGIGWWKMPAAQVVDVPVEIGKLELEPEPTALAELQPLDLLGQSASKTISSELAAKELGLSTRSLNVYLTPGYIRSHGLLTRNGKEYTRGPRGFINVRTI